MVDTTNTRTSIIKPLADDSRAGAPGKVEQVRPDVCPCCGAPLVVDRLEKMRVREFRYACGASGMNCEEYRTDLYLPDPALVNRSAPEWTDACRFAMPTLFEGRRYLWSQETRESFS
jgi:hypothetical protein